MVLGKLDTTCQRAALNSVHTTHKKLATHRILHTKSLLPWSSEDRHSSAVNHAQALSPHFSSIFFTFPSAAPPPGRPWEDPTSVRVNRTPQSPKAEALAGPEGTWLLLEWSWPPHYHPRVPEAKQSKQVLRRWGSRQLCWQPSPQAECTSPGQLKEVGSRSLPANGRAQNKPPSPVQWRPHFSEGSFTASIKLQKIKLKQNQITHNFSKIVT